MELLEHLSPNEQAKGREIHFEKGQILAHERDICQGVYFLLHGRIRIASYALSGQEMVYNLVSDGQMFGNNLVFSKSPEFRGTVIADTAGSCLYFKKTELLNLLQANPSFLNAYLSYEAEFVKRLNAKIKLLSLSSAEERLEFWLYANGGAIECQSVTRLALDLSLSREATSRLLHRLQKEDRIEIENHRISQKGN